MSHFIDVCPNASSSPATGPFLTVSCGDALEVGDCVYPVSYISSVYNVKKADPHDITLMPAIGIVTEQLSATEYKVQISGICEGAIDGLTVGKTVFVGEDGKLTQTPPKPASFPYVFIQSMGNCIGHNVIILSPNFGMTKVIA